ncbi:MAG: hypothetical protein Kow00103_06590 [Candidatus Caldatribacteriota bacterium]
MIESFIDIPLDISNLAAGLSLREIPTNISVGIKGPKNIVNNLSSGEMVGIIDFSEIKEPGIYKLKIDVKPPNRTEIIRVIPAEISVIVEQILTKTVAVEYDLIGIPEKGYSLAGEPKIMPERVNITGPSSILEKVKQVVLVIDISGINKDLTEQGTLKAIDMSGKEIREIKIEPDTVEFSIFLTEGYPTKLLLVKPRITGKPAPGYFIFQILITPEELEIMGNFHQLNQMEWLETIPIDVNGITKTLSVKVPPLLEEGLSIIGEQNSLIEVTIQVQESIISRTIKEIPVNLKNVSPFLSCQIKPSVVDLTIEGRYRLINEIKEEEIEAWVEFNDEILDQQTLPVKVQLPEEVKLIEINPSEVVFLINK